MTQIFEKHSGGTQQLRQLRASLWCEIALPSGSDGGAFDIHANGTWIDARFVLYSSLHFLFLFLFDPIFTRTSTMHSWPGEISPNF